MALLIKQKSTLNWRHLVHRLRSARRVLVSLADCAWQSVFAARRGCWATIRRRSPVRERKRESVISTTFYVWQSPVHIHVMLDASMFLHSRTHLGLTHIAIRLPSENFGSSNFQSIPQPTRMNTKSGNKSSPTPGLVHHHQPHSEHKPPLPCPETFLNHYSHSLQTPSLTSSCPLGFFRTTAISPSPPNSNTYSSSPLRPNSSTS